MMDHEDALERLELAAVEPGGLDRLMAGDTVDAAAVASPGRLRRLHRRVRRLSRAVPLLRDVVRTTPPADLRERTLALFGCTGGPGARPRQPRRGPAPAGVPPVQYPAVRGCPARGRRPAPAVGRDPRRRVVLSVAATSFLACSR